MTATLTVLTLGWSAYRTYLTRLEITNSVRAVEFVQALVTRAFRHTGMPPASERDLGPVGPLDPPRRSISAIHVHHGRIEIVFAPDTAEGVAGLSVYLTPFENADQQITWLCGNRTPPVGLFPLGFSEGTSPAARLLTTVDERYLPSFCR